jgi:hypothetical protein
MAFIVTVMHYNKLSCFVLHCIRNHVTKPNKILLAALPSHMRN